LTIPTPHAFELYNGRKTTTQKAWTALNQDPSREGGPRNHSLNKAVFLEMFLNASLMSPVLERVDVQNPDIPRTAPHSTPPNPDVAFKKNAQPTRTIAQLDASNTLQ
jgi:hypothetical protein